MAAKKPWRHGSLKLWEVGKRECRVRYKSDGKVIAVAFSKIEPDTFSEESLPAQIDLQKPHEKHYPKTVDIDQKLKKAFNTLDFLSDDAKAFIDKVARDDAGGNFNIDSYVVGDRRVEWRQAEAERIRGIRARMSPEKTKEERAKAAARMRALRQSRQAAP